MWDRPCMLAKCNEQEILADITNIGYVISIKNDNMENFDVWDRLKMAVQ
jgi:hypothetical protein